jgi:hypothetical protein
MRILAQFTAVAIMLGFAASGSGLQAAQENSGQAKASTATPAQTSAARPAPPQDSLAEAARKAREKQKEEPKTGRVFTNDNLPTTGGISTVGQATAPAGSTSPEGTETGTSATASSGSGENFWRDRFATLRHKLEQDQENLSILQRELGTLSTQFYSDPNKQLQQQLTRSDIDKKTSDIDKAKAQVAADQQAISDAEDDLRKAGGDSGWAR